MAVADANCTLSSDLSGIYFAVQGNYEQQFVSANKQALDAGVREYKAAFAKAIKTMPALLRAALATPNLMGSPGFRPACQAWRHGQALAQPLLTAVGSPRALARTAYPRCGMRRP